MTMTYQELIEKRRSIRDFIDKSVSLETIKSILSDVSFAPSACNMQPWKFIVINDTEVIKKLSDHNKDLMMQDIKNNPDSIYKNFEGFISNKNLNLFYNAPCLIYLVAEKNRIFVKEDISLATTYLMLSATAHGLGTCWIGLGQMVKAQDLVELIGLSKEDEIYAAIILGYPKNIPAARNKADPNIVKIVC